MPFVSRPPVPHALVVLGHRTRHRGHLSQQRPPRATAKHRPWFFGVRLWSRPSERQSAYPLYHALFVRAFMRPATAYSESIEQQANLAPSFLPDSTYLATGRYRR